MYEVILYGVLAAITLAVLFSVLGKSVGHGADDPINLQKLHAQPSSPAAANAPVFEGPASMGLQAIYAADNSFSPDQFLEGAKGAYSMILEAYAQGDKETLDMLLTDGVYKAYSEAIDEREGQNLTQITDLARLIDANITDASRSLKRGEIAVKFTSEMATALKDEEGNVVDGDPNLLMRVTEVWRFERRLDSKNPNWLLSDVEADDVGMSPDNAPDTA